MSIFPADESRIQEPTLRIQARDASVVLNTSNPKHPGVIHYSIPLTTLKLTRAPWDYVKQQGNRFLENSPAVYFVVCDSTEADENCAVYIGSTGSAQERLVQHKDNALLDGAHTVYVVTSSSLELTGSHCRQLEAILQKVTADQPSVGLLGQSQRLFEMSDLDVATMRMIVPQLLELLQFSGFPIHNYNPLSLDNVPFMPETFSKSVMLDTFLPLHLQPELWLLGSKKNGHAKHMLSGSPTIDNRFTIHPGSYFCTEKDRHLKKEDREIRNFIKSKKWIFPTLDSDEPNSLVLPVTVDSPAQALKVMLRTETPRHGEWKIYDLSPGESAKQAMKRLMEQMVN